jgi:hypothetical protein
VAVRALPPGAVRRRTFFGLLDADGWAAAFFKALFWFLLILFLLGYVPDRAYYFMVSKSIDVGFNAIPLVNLCPAENGGIDCPAPDGAVVPWQTSPQELALPEPRTGAGTFLSGENLYVIGGETADGAVASVAATRVTEDGNFEPWSEGPALPEPRSGAAVTTLSGVPYVIGGLDASRAPTTTVYQGVLEDGRLTEWTESEALVLPQPLSDAAAVSTGDGLFLMGGRTTDGLSATVWQSAFGEANPPTLGEWQELAQLPLPEPRADAAAAMVGASVFLVGGQGPDGITNSVFRLDLEEGQPLVDPTTEQPRPWAYAREGSAALVPEPRAGATAFTASGALYLVGGVGADGEPTDTLAWALPDPATGEFAGWNRITRTDLPEPRAGAAVVNVGASAFAIGGVGPEGPVASAFRANVAPEPPFFRFGLFGLTVPGLGIEGEVGQQLGYLAAAGVGTGNFVLLILIGIAFSHRQGTMRFFERVSRGRFRAPREQEYAVGRDSR